PPGDQPRLVRPVDADEAAAGPVGQDRRARARPERDGTVDRVVEAREAVADVEVAARSGRCRLADADAGDEDAPAVPRQRGGETTKVDDEVRGHPRIAAERSSADPADA